MTYTRRSLQWTSQRELLVPSTCPDYVVEIQEKIIIRTVQWFQVIARRIYVDGWDLDSLMNVFPALALLEKLPASGRYRR